MVVLCVFFGIMVFAGFVQMLLVYIGFQSMSTGEWKAMTVEDRLLCYSVFECDNRLTAGIIFVSSLLMLFFSPDEILVGAYQFFSGSLIFLGVFAALFALIQHRMHRQEQQFTLLLPAEIRRGLRGQIDGHFGRSPARVYLNTLVIPLLCTAVLLSSAGVILYATTIL